MHIVLRDRMYQKIHNWLCIHSALRGLQIELKILSMGPSQGERDQCLRIYSIWNPRLKAIEATS